MRSNVVPVRLNEQEHAALQAEAEKRGVSVSEVLRDYVKTLLKGKK